MFKIGDIVRSIFRPDPNYEVIFVDHLFGTIDIKDLKHGFILSQRTPTYYELVKKRGKSRSHPLTDFFKDKK